jgi:hypothetical protein
MTATATQQAVFYLDAASNEGLGTWWAYSGTPTEQLLERCSLCLQADCVEPQRTKQYADGVWYLDLGTTTRYADAKGRTRSSKTYMNGVTYKNPMCLCGPYAAIHLGDVQNGGESHFLVTDRIHIHRLAREMIVGRNSLRVEAMRRGSENTSFRCRWNSAPSTGGSPLFHRWLLLEPNIQPQYIVEHRNDYPLDCRESNLKTAKTLEGNNNHTHRMARAFRKQSTSGFEAFVAEMRSERGQYEAILQDLPPLPDCVFIHKRMQDSPAKSILKEDDNADTIFDLDCDDSESSVP